MEPLKITLDWERATKRYHVYVDPTGTLVPSRIYVPSTNLVDGQPPQRVTVTIESAS